MQSELYSAGLESHTLHTVEVSFIKNGLMYAAAQKHGTVHSHMPCNTTFFLVCLFIWYTNNNALFFGLPIYKTFYFNVTYPYLWPAKLTAWNITHFNIFLLGKTMIP